MARREEFTIGRLRLPDSNTAAAASRVTVSLTPVAVAAATIATQSVTIPGVEVGDLVFLAIDPIANSLDCTSVKVTAANTANLRFINTTAGSLTPAAGAYTFLVIKQ